MTILPCIDTNQLCNWRVHAPNWNKKKKKKGHEVFRLSIDVCYRNRGQNKQDTFQETENKLELTM